MADFTPKVRTSGNRAANETGLSSGSGLVNGDLLVNAVSGHLSVVVDNDTQVPIASDIIVTNTDPLGSGGAASAPLHRLAIVPVGTAQAPNDGLIRQVNGLTPDSSGSINLTLATLGAAAANHTHTLDGITDFESGFLDKLGLTFTATIPSATVNWTVNTATDSNGHDVSNIYTDITVSGANFHQDDILFIDMDSTGIEDAYNYHLLADEWQFVYSIERLSATKLRVHASRVLTTNIPISIIVLYSHAS